MSEPKNRRKGGRNTGLQLRHIDPLNKNQEVVITNFRNKHLVLLGFPGTGKTFLALHCALKLVDEGSYERVVIVRSAVTGRDMGFLPGTAEEKMSCFEEPYEAMSTDLYGRADAYGILKTRGIVEFRSTSTNRGLTLKDAVVIVDEAQNLSDQELHTIITRLGDNCKLVLCGDVKQDDLTNPRYKEVSGLNQTLGILRTIPDIKFVDFQMADIVRSDFVRDYIIARYNQEHKGSLDGLKTFLKEPKTQEAIESLQSVHASHGPNKALHDKVV